MHYEIDLLWKNHVSLANNKWIAKKQLYSLEIRFARKPQLGSLYEASIATDIKNYVSVVPDSDANREDAWYLPHHPVTNVNEPGKIRRATSASSIYQGISVNSSLLKGTDLLCNLTGLILRFREKCVALSADIEGCSFRILYPLQIDASYDIYGITKFMSTIAIFLVQQNHRVLLATLFDSVLRTKLPMLTLQV